MTKLLTTTEDSSEDEFSIRNIEIDNMIFLATIQEDLEKLKVEPSQKCIDSILAYAKKRK